MEQILAITIQNLKSIPGRIGTSLVAVVGVNLVSVIGAATIGKAFPGDFEMTEMGVAIAAFSFLPYCQIAGLNVTADIFTANASRSLLAVGCRCQCACSA